MRFREMVQEEEELRAAQSAQPGKSSPRESFRRGKLSATRYYSHAVGIAELYEGYFFLPERRAFFTRWSVGEIAIFKVLQNLVMGDGYKVRSLISDIDPSKAGKWMSGKVLSRSSTMAMQLRNTGAALPLMRPSLKLYFIILTRY